MRQIFVFTAGNPEARQHLVDSVENPVDDEKVFDNFDEFHHEELERIRNEAGGFYAWGAVWGVRNLPTWEQMERDDIVLCVYDGIYHYVARLPRHGPQEEDQRDVHRGAKSPYRSGKQMKIVFALPPPKLSPPPTARHRPRSAERGR